MNKPDPRVSDEAWKKFLVFAESYGIGLEYEEDWGLWFEAFKVGYIAHMEEVTE
jgi:hypothetical protein